MGLWYEALGKDKGLFDYQMLETKRSALAVSVTFSFDTDTPLFQTPFLLAAGSAQGGTGRRRIRKHLGRLEFSEADLSARWNI